MMESKVMAFLTSYLLFLLLSLGFNSGVSKPIVFKTVKSEDGDTFDCFDINHQPAFDHPLLKNHTIQMSPSSYPASVKNRNSSTPTFSHIKMESIQCPSGTIPILRAQNIDLIKYKSSMELGRTKFINSYQRNTDGHKNIHDHNVLVYSSGWDKCYGTRASINVYGLPQVTKDQKSIAGITVFDDVYPHKEFILAGWFVAPHITGDSSSRFAIYWSNLAEDHECYNHLCSGFVQINSNIALGAKISPLSIYNGQQYHITLLIFKDRKTENWWLTFGEDNRLVGYFPKSLFTNLRNEAQVMGWGGLSDAKLGIESPPIGSGHCASEGFAKAAYIRHIEKVDKDNNLVLPKWRNYMAIFDKRCYQVDRVSDDGGSIGLNFYFGGPGGCY